MASSLLLTRAGFVVSTVAAACSQAPPSPDNDRQRFDDFSKDLRAATNAGVYVPHGAVTPAFVDGHLVRLTIGNIPLDSFPASISRFHHLSDLTVYNCGLTQWGGLRSASVGSLCLPQNRLTALPNLRDRFPQLERLDLSQNELRGPVTLARLSPALVSINLARNAISSLAFQQPAPPLVYANFSYNHLTDVDPSICHLAALKSLNVWRNPLKFKLDTATVFCGRIPMSRTTYMD